MAQRINCGKLKDVLEINDLIGIQTDSYKHFLQREISSDNRENQGLHEVFKEIFPIESFDKQLVVSYLGYTLGEEKISSIDCIKDGATFCAPLYLDCAVTCKGETVRESVYMGDMPIMTERGTFVINGAERVIISQLHRSPGICFERTRHTSGSTLYSFRIIPDRGSWLEVQFDIHDNIYIFLDRRRRRRKFLITTFLRAIGYDTNRDILDAAYGVKSYTIPQLLKEAELSEFFTVESVTDEHGQEVLKGLEPMNEMMVKSLQTAGIKKVELIHLPQSDSYLITCLQKDSAKTQEDALKEIYRRMRPTDPASVPNARQLLKRLFFDVKRYDLGTVGRHKLNEKLGMNCFL